MGRSVAGVVLLIAVVAGCSTGQPAPGPSRLGGTWTTVSVPGIVITDLLAAPRIQFTTDGQIQGGTDCTEIKAPFTLRGDRLSVGTIRMLGTVPCRVDDRAITEAFSDALSNADTVSGGAPGDRLVLSGPGGEIVLAQPAVQPDP